MCTFVALFQHSYFIFFPFHLGCNFLSTGEVALGPSINNLYVGGFLHPDDIQMLDSSLYRLDAQVSLVQGFAKENFLKLNTQKSELVVFRK